MRVCGTTTPAADVLREQYRNPYPFFAWLREFAPVFEERGANGPSLWTVSRYADVHELLADARLSKSPDKPAGLLRDVLHTDPPEHTRLRGLIDQVFTPCQVAALAPVLLRCAEQLIYLLPARGTIDVISDFAVPLSVSTICAILGVPDGTRTERFRELAAAFVTFGRERRHTLIPELRGHLATCLRRKPSQDGDNDIVGALISARDDDYRFTDNELIGTAQVLMTVGHDLTMNLIGNSVLALLRHPGQLRRLVACPGLLTTGVDELLRFDCPARTATFRVAREDIPMHGTVIPRGDVVSLAIGSANRDPEHFARADELDVIRQPNEHLSFGLGPHRCIGVALARLQAEIALGRLIERMDLRLAVADSALRWRQSRAVRGLVELPVSYRKF